MARRERTTGRAVERREADSAGMKQLQEGIYNQGVAVRFNTEQISLTQSDCSNNDVSE